MTRRDFFDALYEIKHSTGVIYRINYNDLNLLYEEFELSNVSKEEFVREAIINIHKLSQERKFNWN